MLLLWSLGRPHLWRYNLHSQLRHLFRRYPLEHYYVIRRYRLRRIRHYHLLYRFLLLLQRLRTMLQSSTFPRFPRFYSMFPAFLRLLLLLLRLMYRLFLGQLPFLLPFLFYLQLRLPHNRGFLRPRPLLQHKICQSFGILLARYMIPTP